MSGPSGVGKSSVIDAVLEQSGASFSVSATTRASRPGEVDGEDYQFVDQDTFTELIRSGGMLEWAEYGGYRYGTPRAPVLDVLDQGTFWFSDTPEVPGSTSWGNDIPRICTWAHLRDRTSGRAFYVYNVHWDHRSQPSRERGAELLIQRIAQRTSSEDPVLVTGDFNAGESNAAFRQLVNAPTAGLSDTFRALHPDADGVGTFNGFEGETSGEKIDAVLASAGWEILAAEIVRDAPRGRYPSDHFPVTATVIHR